MICSRFVALSVSLTRKVSPFQTDTNGELYSVGWYDTWAFGLWVLCIPVAGLVSIVHKWRAVVQNEIATRRMVSKAQRLEEAFRRYQLMRDKDEDRQLLNDHIIAMKESDAAELQEAGLLHEPHKPLCSPDSANVCQDTLVCEGEWQSTATAQPVRCAVKVRPISLGQALVTENAIRLQVNHENLCGMLSAVETPTSHYLIMQLCATSLQDAVDAGRLEDAVGNPSSLRVCSGLIEAIDALHSHGFVHGNVNPANVLLDEAGNAKLSGFSCAARLQDDGSCTLSILRCTPGFSPPEVINGATESSAVKVDDPQAVDAFGLGCTMFAAISGGRAFAGATPEHRIASVIAGNSRVELDSSVSLEAQNLIKGLVAADPTTRTKVSAALAHPLFWSPQQAMQYLAGVGAALPVGVARAENPFVAAMEAAVDELIGEYSEEEPGRGGSWARQLDSRYPIGGDWGRAQRPPEEDEHNYFIYGLPPRKKQIEARQKLVADGKPLGPHVAKRIRCVGLLKFVRNLSAHKAEHLAAGRFESEAAIVDYIRLSLPWLLMTVHTFDAQHKQFVDPTREEAVDDSAEGRRLRMSFAANAHSVDYAHSADSAQTDESMDC